MQFQISNWQQLDKTAQQALLERPLQQESDSLKQTVRDIIRAVRSEGDAALLRFSRDFDKLQTNPLRLSEQQQQSLIASLSDELKTAIQIAYRNIRTFHAAQLPENIRIETQPGVVCELNYSALDQVGLYVPGGSAPLPSTVLMLGVPAQLAGCRRVVLVTPPGQPSAGTMLSASRQGACSRSESASKLAAYRKTVWFRNHRGSSAQTESFRLNLSLSPAPAAPPRS